MFSFLPTFVLILDKAFYNKGMRGTMTCQSLESDGGEFDSVKVDAFADRMNIAIKRAGGVTKVSKSTGMSASVIRKWRAGQSEPTRTSLVKMAEAARVPVAWLATGESDPDRETATEQSRRGGVAEDINLDLLERVAQATFEGLEERDLELEPAAQARLLRVLYRHFASRNEQPDYETVSNIIDLAAYR